MTFKHHTKFPSSDHQTPVLVLLQKKGRIFWLTHLRITHQSIGHGLHKNGDENHEKASTEKLQ